MTTAVYFSCDHLIRPTFDMSGVRKGAKPSGAHPLDKGLRARRPEQRQECSAQLGVLTPTPMLELGDLSRDV
jgi:hypothetical protein